MTRRARELGHLLASMFFGLSFLATLFLMWQAERRADYARAAYEAALAILFYLFAASAQRRADALARDGESTNG